MGPEFANPAGLWALLAVPALLTIHIFQQRTRPIATSTLFLIEALAPASRSGRRWDRLRTERSLWLQLLAIVLAAWVLAGPHWVRTDSVQTVAVVLDSSAAMAGFRPEAEKAVARLLAGMDGRAARTVWLLMTSDPRSVPLYRGTDRTAALASIASWRPSLGTHDVQPALRLAQALAGANGLTWFVTDSKAKVPPGQAAVGVGRPLSNVGFAGATVLTESGVLVWRAFVKNHSAVPQSRSWWVEAGGERTAVHRVEFAPGALLELSGRIPAGVERCLVVLDTDEFGSDDRLPLVCPAAKPLAVRVDLDGEPGTFFRKVLGTLDGVSFSPGATPRLLVGRRAVDAPAPAVATIALPPEPKPADGTQVLRAPVVAEKHPLLSDLNWQGLLGSGPGDFSPASGDEMLLWQNERPLAWLSGAADDTRSLVLNFEWNDSNAARLPAAALLVRRYAERVRDAQPGPWAANFDCGAQVPLTALDRTGAGPLTLEFQPADSSGAVARVLEPAELQLLRAPDQSGFFLVRWGGQVLVRGAAHFADPRQADFRDAETFTTPPSAKSEALFLQTTQPDPFTTCWLALIGLCLLGSWSPERSTATSGGRAREAA